MAQSRKVTVELPVDVLVEPMTTDVMEWFAELDRFASEPFMEQGCDQPPVPVRDVF